MSLLERLNNDMKQAMKNKEKDKLSVIRMMKASIQNEAIKQRQDLTDDEELTVLSRELKQRKDSLQEFENAGREDLVDKVRTELVYVEAYMPEQLSEEEISEIVKQTILEVRCNIQSRYGESYGSFNA